MSEPASPPQPPLLRVVRGEPTPEELAALVTVVAALAAAGDSEPKPPPPPSAWNHPSRLVRGPMSAGPDGWRRSSWPR